MLGSWTLDINLYPSQKCHHYFNFVPVIPLGLGYTVANMSQKSLKGDEQKEDLRLTKGVMVKVKWFIYIYISVKT